MTLMTGSLWEKLFFPTLLGLVSFVLLNLAERIFVGRSVGSDALAAINIAAPVFQIATGNVQREPSLSGGPLRTNAVNRQGHSVSLFLLRILVPVIHQMRHDIMRQGAVPSLRSALGVDLVLRRGELVQQVEGFEAGDKLALEERLTDGDVEHKVVGVQFAAAIASARVHRAVGRERGFKYRDGVAEREAVTVVEGVQRLEINHLPPAVTPAEVTSSAYIQHTFIILYVDVVVQGQGIHGVQAAFVGTVQHGVVEPMNVSAIKRAFCRPMLVLVQR